MSGSDSDPSLEQDASSTTYVSAVDFEKIDQGAWYDGIHSLNDQFNQICGDTFCEGDYSNITPLTFACSVTSKAGNVKDCAWNFAASQLDVDPKSAAIVTQAPTFECHIKMKTTAVKLAAILAGGDSLHATLPGAPAATPSIYDQLSDCFDHPFAQDTGTYATTGTDSYVSSRDYYTSAAGAARWDAAKNAVIAGFDNVCGDTFCSSDYGDLQSMSLECAVTKSTGNVKSCAWVFGGSYFFVPEKTGQLQTEHKSFRCNFAVKGTLPQLITTWTAAGTDSVIRRPLPGVTASAYDALGGCLP
jgi:hypothetical protein